MMKNKDIVLLEDAVIDLNNGYDFYDSIEKGVGNLFWDSLLSDIKSLEIHSGIHSIHSSLYRMPAKRFPYCIYYYLKENRVFIVAILPMRRNPEWIEIQIKDRL